MRSKALPQFLCDKCFKNSGLEESLTLGSFLPRNCIVCGETVSKDYNFVWGKDIEHVWGKSKKFLKKDLKMERKDGKTLSKVQKGREIVHIETEDLIIELDVTNFPPELMPKSAISKSFIG